MPSIESKHVQTGGSPVEIAYIGTKEIKNDTLCRSGVTWFGQFDIQSVDPVAASRLLRFPSVFIRADKLEAYMEDLEESLAEDGTDDEVADQDAPSLADADKTLSTDDAIPDPAEDGAKLKAIEAIQTVIISLDQENPEHFTTKGKPKVEAVRSRMPDVEVSADDVAEAYKGLEVG
jgi:hypothetical protein